MIHIVDYGMGNLGSVENMLLQLGANPIMASTPETLESAQKIILPGVGAFDQAMEALKSKGLQPLLDKKVKEEKVPILGICLGMQLMSRASEEGQCEGLGWIDAQTRRFPPSPNYRVPHMGWNTVEAKQGASFQPSWHAPPRFYFVHSYFLSCRHAEDRWLTCSYGPGFDAGFIHENLIGVQFHPEKSHRFGKALFQAFIDWEPT